MLKRDVKYFLVLFLNDEALGARSLIFVMNICFTLQERPGYIHVKLWGFFFLNLML